MPKIRIMRIEDVEIVARMVALDHDILTRATERQ
jgi:hypothetical protein